MSEKPYVLTKEHFLAFGVIVHSFARFERLVEIATHYAIGGRFFAFSALVISGLTYQAKSDALTAIMKAAKFPDNHSAIIVKALADFNVQIGLRNLIAHHIWREGLRDDSIRPIKLSARGGKATLRGHKDTEQDYTLEELSSVALSLDEQIASFEAFLKSIGAFDEAARNMAATKASSSQLGHPSSASHL